MDENKNSFKDQIITKSYNFQYQSGKNHYQLRSVSKEEFDLFVKKHSYTDMCQLSSWSKVKEPAWTSEHLALFSGDDFVASASLLFRKIPMTPWSLSYIPRGFLVDYNNDDDLKAIIEAVKFVAKKHRAFEIKIDPNVQRKESVDVVEKLIDKGFKHKGFTMGIVDSQPRFSMITNLDRPLEDILNSFDKSAKQGVKRSEKFGLQFEEYGQKGLEIFNRIMQETAERDGFNPRNLEYFKKIINSFGREEAGLYLVSVTKDQLINIKSKELVDIEKEKKAVEKKKNKFLNNLENDKLDIDARENIEKKISNLQGEIDKLTTKIEATEQILQDHDLNDGQGSQKIYLAGAIMVYCGPIAYYLYAGSSNEYRELYPNYFMQWELMKLAQQRGCTKYDFGGVSGYTEKSDLKNDDLAGLYTFKKVFASDLFERIGEFDLIINNSVHKLFYFLMEMRKKLLQLRKK
ncbi:MAG: peptidoglycan bridge formation glycyltransferase FemA/FemB family protein [Tissierellia bacterium]|nr:peptidoglycan bridge formation glycyltransferase FemA/FemB family protein [Tissierellia bacterium]